MIGNDVIDLALAATESNYKRRGFLDKLFIAAEKHLILESENPEIKVWELWSKKEAAYKIYNRLTGIRAFMPLRIDASSIGTVVCDQFTFAVQTKITGSHIHSIAVADGDYLKKVLVLDQNVPVVKINGLPFYQIQDSLQPISISHHGNFKMMVTLA